MIVQETLNRLQPMPGEAALRWTDEQIRQAMQVTDDPSSEWLAIMRPWHEAVQGHDWEPGPEPDDPVALSNVGAYLLASHLEPTSELPGNTNIDIQARATITRAMLRSQVEFSEIIADSEYEDTRWKRSREAYIRGELEWRELFADQYRTTHEVMFNGMKEGDVALLGLTRAEVKTRIWKVSSETPFRDCASIYVNTLIAALFIGTVADYHAEPALQQSFNALIDRLRLNGHTLRQMSRNALIKPEDVGPVELRGRHLVRGYEWNPL